MDNTPKDNDAVLHKKKYDLAELVARVNPDSLHSEVDWGPAQGRETW